MSSYYWVPLFLLWFPNQERISNTLCLLKRLVTLELPNSFVAK